MASSSGNLLQLTYNRTFLSEEISYVPEQRSSHVVTAEPISRDTCTMTTKKTAPNLSDVSDISIEEVEVGIVNYNRTLKRIPNEAESNEGHAIRAQLLLYDSCKVSTSVTPLLHTTSISPVRMYKFIDSGCEDVRIGNAKAKEAMNSTVADRNNGEECNEVRDDQGHSGEGDDNKLGLPCLSEQSKTISFNVLLLCTAHNNTTTKSSRMFTARKVPESVAALKLAIQEEPSHSS
ncbi:hypothetical protein EMCRGX_G006795 [Ephydatia muelleri]